MEAGASTVRPEPLVKNHEKQRKIMALKVKAKEQFQNVGKYAGTFRYVMMPELYTALAQDKVIKEAALRSGGHKGVRHLCAVCNSTEMPDPMCR